MEVYILFETDCYGALGAVLGVFSDSELALNAADENNVDKKYRCVCSYKLNEFEISDYL